MHDLTNSKSRYNLRRWVKELAAHVDPSSMYNWIEARRSHVTMLIINEFRTIMYLN